MSTIWTPGMVDTGGLTDRLLVLGPRGFLATSDTVLFEKAWVSTLDLHVGSIHGVGYLNGSPIHMIQTASTQELPSCAWMSLRHLMLERDLETYKMLAQNDCIEGAYIRPERMEGPTRRLRGCSHGCNGKA